MQNGSGFVVVVGCTAGGEAVVVVAVVDGVVLGRLLRSFLDLTTFRTTVFKPHLYTQTQISHQCPLIQ